MSDVKYAVIDPSDGRLVSEYPTHTDEEISRAVGSANEAFRSWGRHGSVVERAELLRKVATLHVERRDQFAAIISREMGKAVESALFEIDFSASIYAYYADNAAAFLADQDLPLMGGEGTALLRREPLGVLLGIMPWNFPAYQVARFAAPHLAAGNTVLLKHAPQCPESASFLETVFRDAGFPPGAYVNVYATNAQVETIIADSRVQGVSLTGSERAGSAVAEIAGRHLKKVVLELGGSDPVIVLSTDDMDATVEDAAQARVAGNAGQACNAGKRVIVHESIYDEFVEKFTARMVGAPAVPLSSQAAAERLEQQVNDAVAQGAQLAADSERQGAWYPTSVLTGIEVGSATSQEELFGPVAMVFKVGSEDEAIVVANDTPYGLGSYVFTTDREQARRVAEQIDAGMVIINGVYATGAELPFGGVKRSGYGRELGPLGIDEFVNKKLIRTVR
ncbi:MULTISPECIES: aldehyde dehydrogenase family protein [unclassified Nocardioides]|uniref:aldehyde dehydrogenase family protein n=1 Tax=unclassified Nocardioides TaxID=2615069 RepID=UPI0007036E33|nr:MULTISPECIES: aldehyde dehydrogenase family protein [unclassified Nocardioides]KRC54722.1 succinate-semialdehyde dehydrogenase [Nocardioides sp. Root79]KRC73933.1 succinate-semialdehyde dehydrogenase [Nocardioides sp. Root240]